MQVEQLFDAGSSTYSYLLWDEHSREAALIDPVREQVAQYSAQVRHHGLTLKYTLETHVHADQISGSGLLKKTFNSIVIAHENSRTRHVDVLVSDCDFIPLGSQRIKVLFTPGHTDNHVCYTIPGAIFTGDSLLIGSCGRTDHRSGNAAALFDSINGKLFAFPDETLIYPGHDYHGKTTSTIGEEKLHNPQIGIHVSRQTFIETTLTLQQGAPMPLCEALPASP